MSKMLIINCDDLGPNKNVLNGLKMTLKNHIVTSASVIINYGNLDEISAFAKANKSFGLGVHLNFTSGRPILPAKKIPSLVNENGFFHDRTAILKGKKINSTELQCEFDAQIQQFLIKKIKPTHLDNHHPEIYFFPELFQVSINLAIKYDLPLRIPFTPNFLAKIEKYSILYECSKDLLIYKSNEILNMCKFSGIRSPDYFYIDFTQGNKDESSFIDIINNLDFGINEICVHIGTSDPCLEKELNVLMNPRIMSFIERKKIELVSYSIFGVLS